MNLSGSIENNYVPHALENVSFCSLLIGVLQQHRHKSLLFLLLWVCSDSVKCESSLTFNEVNLNEREPFGLLEKKAVTLCLGRGHPVGT